jgi:mevalonate kinase
VDAYDLHAFVSKGSGYDIACARSDKPLLYQYYQGNRMVRAVSFNPDFFDKVYFVYLGHKKDTQRDVDKFLKNKQDYSKQTRRVSEISLQLAESASYEEFSGLINEHEHIMAEVLGDIPIKQKLFNDFRGEVKSLGAWGGDFAMVLWPYQKKELLSYLTEKNINVVFGLKEMRYEHES